MNLAIVSTPRSGNTWVRLVLRETLGLNLVGAHNYREVETVPDNCLLQLHWYREPNFQAFLRDNGFRVVVIARHPLDVLLSILHFIRYGAQTSRWLEGNGEIPAGLADQAPTSAAFQDYATSWGAENLLSISYQWWHDQSAVRVRYEDLTASPRDEFGALLRGLDASAEGLDLALANNGFDSLRNLPNRHGWQGRPELWRDLIPYETARAIQARHAMLFETLGYDVTPTDLDPVQAEANWAALKR